MPMKMTTSDMPGWLNTSRSKRGERADAGAAAQDAVAGNALIEDGRTGHPLASASGETKGEITPLTVRDDQSDAPVARFYDRSSSEAFRSRRMPWRRSKSHLPEHAQGCQSEKTGSLTGALKRRRTRGE